MSHPSPNAAAQPQSLPSPLSPNPAELAARLERVQTAARDLLAACAAAGHGPTSGQEPASNADGETRCYYLSAATVRQERELLQRYNVRDLHGLLAETHMLLAGLVRIMKNTRLDARVKGHVIVSLGCLLEQACALALRMRNVYGGVERVSR